MESQVTYKGTRVFRSQTKGLLFSPRNSLAAKILRHSFPDENAFQLYNLTLDIGETKNLYTQKTDEAAKLQAYLNACRDNGRSHPVWSETAQDDPRN